MLNLWLKHGMPAEAKATDVVTCIGRGSTTSPGDSGPRAKNEKWDRAKVDRFLIELA